MFNLSDMFPASNVLSQIQGVEESLRKRRRMGAFGWVVFIGGSTIQLLAEFNNLGLLSIADIWNSNPWLAAGLSITAFVVIGALLVAVWSTFWISQSKRPFRYTCNIGEFEPLTETIAEDQKDLAEKLKFLPLDLSRQLNDRVQRFGFLETDTAAEQDDEEGVPLEAHIHIHGYYVVRQTTDSEDYEIEVTPSVRIGPMGSSEVLAPTPPPTVLTGDMEMTRKTYNELLEQIYHSVVSEVYRQLQEDVQRKIDLLPTGRLKAIALLYEADDYASSNTLHAYDQATELYYKAAQIIDPTLRATPSGFLLRFFFGVHCYITVLRRQLRNFEANYRPAAAETSLLRTRAMIGYARMLCFRRQLSSVVGATTNETYEAVRILENAYASLEKLSTDVPDCDLVKFECYTIWALSLHDIGDSRAARQKLINAIELDPIRAEQDAIYLFANATISEDRRTRLTDLRRAVELEPRLEVAQFVLALEIETLWRSKDSFEPNVANNVLKEYAKVLKINPGNLGAWANSGYISWLLGGKYLEDAKYFFTQGRRFKEIKRDVYVSELEFGLARIYAELGKFKEAYTQYVASTSRMITGANFQSYYSTPMTRTTLRRYQDYYVEFTRHARDARAEESEKIFDNLNERRRLRNSIHAFVLCDLGEVYASAYFADNLDEGDRGNNILKRAQTAMKCAIRHNPDYAYPHYLLSLLQFDYVEARENLLQAVKLEPMWADAMMQLVRVQSQAAREFERESEQTNEKRKDVEVKRAELGRLKEEQQKLAAESQRQANLVIARPDVSDNARAASSAIRQQYNFEADTGSPQLARRAQQSSVTPTQTSKVNYQKLIKDLRKEIGVLNDEIKLHQTRASGHQNTALTYREESRRSIRKLLPHGWLWSADEFNWSALKNRQYERGLRWERELTGIHVTALHHWALRFLYDDNRTNDALPLLEHIAKHFKPADPNILENILKLKLRVAKNVNEKKQLVAQFCAKNYCVLNAVPELEELGFSLQEEIDLLSRATGDSCVTKNPFLKKRLLNQLAEALQRKASEPENKTPVEILYEALDKAESTDIEAKLRIDIAQRLLPTKEISILETAIDHVARHDALIDYDNFTLKLSKLKADRAELLRIRGSVDLWGNRGKKFTAVAPLISVRLGKNLAGLADLTASEEDRKRTQIIRDLENGMFWELGLLFPAPEIDVDNKIEESCRYYIDLEGLPLVTQELNLDQRLVNGTRSYLQAKGIEATETVNPANGAECAFISNIDYQAHKDFIDELGYSWSPFSYIVLHVAAVIRKQAITFLRVDRVAELLKHHGLVTELETLLRDNKLIALTNVLRGLVTEEIPIRRLSLIVELFQSEFDKCESLTELTETIRNHHNFRRNIPYLNRPHHYFVPLGPRFEQAIREGLDNGGGQVLALTPELTQNLLHSVRSFVTSLDPESQNPVIMTRPELRLWVRRLVELEFPHFAVLSEKEVLPEHLESVRGELELI